MHQHDGKRHQPEQWIDARAAAEKLGIKRATLYAYVSRGRVTSRPAPDGRGRVYLEADLDRLRAHRDARSGHGAAAAGALRWGAPVLDSAITEIADDGPRYRGRSAVELADAGFERVAELLWIGALPDAPPPWRSLDPHRVVRALDGTDDLLPLDALCIALPRLAVHDPARFVRSGPGALDGFRRIARALPVVLAARAGLERARAAADAPTVATALRIALDGRPDADSAIERALVLCADHELNASSFAARITASAGADAYACVLSAVGTLGGVRHGGLTERVAALVAEVGAPERASRVVGARLRRGEAMPGFGHPLYAEGDPRTPPLLEAARDVDPASVTVRVVDALVDTLALVGGGRPTLDVGLTALADAAGLGRGGALAMFAVGRCAGWLAHVAEQREADFLLRPRARYVGPSG